MYMNNRPKTLVIKPAEKHIFLSMILLMVYYWLCNIVFNVGTHISKWVHCDNYHLTVEE